eukprot:267854-Heterocapsa_arctica.AAC.1
MAVTSLASRPAPRAVNSSSAISSSCLGSRPLLLPAISSFFSWGRSAPRASTPASASASSCSASRPRFLTVSS